jgi:hypothetical protein
MMDDGDADGDGGKGRVFWRLFIFLSIRHISSTK